MLRFWARNYADIIQLLLGHRNLSTITEEVVALIVLNNTTNPTECYDCTKYLIDLMDMQFRALNDKKRNEFKYYSSIMHLMVFQASIYIQSNFGNPEDSNNLYVQNSFSVLHWDSNNRSYISACVEVLFLQMKKIFFYLKRKMKGYISFSRRALIGHSRKIEVILDFFAVRCFQRLSKKIFLLDWHGWSLSVI